LDFGQVFELIKRGEMSPQKGELPFKKFCFL